MQVRRDSPTGVIMDGTNCQGSGDLYIINIPGWVINGWKYVYHAAYAVNDDDKRWMYLYGWDSNGTRIDRQWDARYCWDRDGVIRCRWRVSPALTNATSWWIRFIQDGGNVHWDTTWIWTSNLDYADKFPDYY